MMFTAAHQQACAQGRTGVLRRVRAGSEAGAGALHEGPAHRPVLQSLLMPAALLLALALPAAKAGAQPADPTTLGITSSGDGNLGDTLTVSGVDASWPTVTGVLGAAGADTGDRLLTWFRCTDIDCDSVAALSGFAVASVTLAVGSLTYDLGSPAEVVGVSGTAVADDYILVTASELGPGGLDDATELARTIYGPICAAEAATCSAAQVFPVPAAPEDPPAPTSITVESTGLGTPPEMPGYYMTMDVIQATLTFSAAVAVDTTGGTPHVVIEVGENDRQAGYDAAASGAADDTELIFSYTVIAADLDVDGIVLSENSLALNGAVISAATGTATVETDFAALETDAHTVNVAPPPAELVLDEDAVVGTPLRLRGENLDANWPTLDEAGLAAGTSGNAVLWQSCSDEECTDVEEDDTESNLFANTGELSYTPVESDVRRYIRVSVFLGTRAEFFAGMAMVWGQRVVGPVVLPGDPPTGLRLVGPAEVGSTLTLVGTNLHDGWPTVDEADLAAYAADLADEDKEAVPPVGNFVLWQSCADAACTGVGADDERSNLSNTGLLTYTLSDDDLDRTIRVSVFFGTRAEFFAGTATLYGQASTDDGRIDNPRVGPSGSVARNQERRRRNTQGTLASLGRTLVSTSLDVIGARFSAPGSGNGAVSGGQSPGSAAGAGAMLQSAARALGAGGARSAKLPSSRQLLAGSAFEFSLDEGGPAGWMTPGGGRLALWGRGSAGGFRGSPEAGASVDGDLVAGHLGMDYRSDKVVLGLALGRSESDVDFSYRKEAYTTADFIDSGASTSSPQGEEVAYLLETRLTTVQPYMNFTPRPGMGVFGVLGYGIGKVTLEGEGVQDETDLELRMAALGVSNEVSRPSDASRLLVKGDLALVQLETDAFLNFPGLAKVRADYRRLRVALAGEARLHKMETGGGSLHGNLEIAGRIDSGDASPGAGVEVAAGLSIFDPRVGVEMTARGRVLVAHNDADFEEWAAGLDIRFDPGSRGGMQLTLAPAWGALQGSALFEDGDALQHAARRAQRSQAGPAPGRLDMELGYAHKVLGGRGRVLPFGRLNLARQASRLRGGLRFDFQESGAAAAGRLRNFDMELFTERRSAGGAAQDGRVGLELRMGF